MESLCVESPKSDAESLCRSLPSAQKNKLGCENSKTGTVGLSTKQDTQKSCFVERPKRCFQRKTPRRAVSNTPRTEPVFEFSHPSLFFELFQNSSSGCLSILICLLLLPRLLLCKHTYTLELNKQNTRIRHDVRAQGSSGLYAYSVYEVYM